MERNFLGHEAQRMMIRNALGERIWKTGLEFGKKGLDAEEKKRLKRRLRWKRRRRLRRMLRRRKRLALPEEVISSSESMPSLVSSSVE